MAKQYVYNAIPVEQAYDQNKILYQYQTGSNPLYDLGLQGTQYTFVDTSSKNSNKTQKNAINHNTAYTTNVKQQIYLDQNQAYSIPGHNTDHLLQYQTDHKIIQDAYHQANPYQIQNNQPITQPQVKQKQNISKQAYVQHNVQINPEIYVQNPSHQQKQQYQTQQQIYPQIQQKLPQQQKPQNKQIIQQQIIQPQINAQIQQNLPQNQQYQYQHHKQIVQPQVQQQIQQIINPQVNIQQNQQKKIIPQTQNQQIIYQNSQNQQIIYQNYQNHQQPQYQYSNKYQSKEQQKLEPSNINQYIPQNIQQQIPQQIQYQNYIQIQNYDNLNQNEYLINQPVYQVQNPVIQVQNYQNVTGTLPLSNNNSGTVNNYTIPKKKNMLNPKHFEIPMSLIQEEDINIAQSGFISKKSLVNNSNAEIKDEEIKEEGIKEEEIKEEEIKEEEIKGVNIIEEKKENEK